MASPYFILDLTADAGDDDVRRAYLQKVKDNPPDRDPERFRLIREAYEALKDRRSRLDYALFTPPEADFSRLLDRAFDISAPALTPDQLQRLLKSSSEKP